jgi:DNA-binding response OmpR family regulator
MYKILVADDDYAIKQLYQLELEDEGYNVATTGEYKNFMAQIECLQPDLIILDAGFGGNNGFYVLQEIRNKYCEQPVILCSAYDLLRFDVKALGVDCYVIKSSDLSEINGGIDHDRYHEQSNSSKREKGDLKMSISEKTKEKVDDATKEIKAAIDNLGEEVAELTWKARERLKGKGVDLKESAEELSKEFEKLSERIKDIIPKEEGRGRGKVKRLLQA